MIRQIPVYRKPLFVLALLAILFIGPVLAAWSLYTNRQPLLEDTVNNGQLILPPASIRTLDLQSSNGVPIKLSHWHGKWLMLYVQPQNCDKICENNLYKMRQVRLALGANQNRVDRVIVTEQGKRDPYLTTLLTGVYSGMQHAVTPPSAFETFLTKLPLKNVAIQQGSLYLVDPLGNIMMRYPSSAPAKGLLKDMTRLLKLSNIG